MYLEKLEIQGFKSFANKTTLQFPHLKTSQGITAIVGPNGSGKSNVADAVRWALGEQSLKILRGKKSEDVIFSGSETKGRLGFSEVSLFLNNEDKKMPVDYSQVIITRRIYRNGEGEYFLNKNKVRLQDILMLLAKSSFGQKTYSVIGQGMIDSFLMSSPQEKKDFLDEAVGIREFQLKREQTLNKLIGTKENLEQTLTVLMEIKPQLRSLTRQVNRLEKREKIEQELKELQENYYGYKILNLRKNLKTFNEQYQKQEHLKNNQQKTIDEIQNQLDKFETEKSRTEIFENLQNQYNSLNDKKNLFLRELATINGKMDLEFEKQGKIDIAWANKKIQELEAEAKDIKEQLENNKLSSKKTSDAVINKEKELNELKNSIIELENNLTEIRNKSAEQTIITLPEIQTEIEKIYYIQEILIADLDKVTELDQLHNIKNKLKELKNSLYSLNKKLKGTGNEDFTNKIIELQDQINKLIQEKSELLSQLNELKIELKFHRNKSDSLESELLKITNEQAKLNSQKEIATQNNKQKALEEISNQKKTLENQLEEAENKLKEIDDKLNGFNKKEEEKRQEIFEIQKNLQKEQLEFAQITQEINNQKIEIARLETKKEDLEKEIIEELGSLSKIDEKKEYRPVDDSNGALEKIYNLKHQLELIGGIDPETMEEYKKIKERHDFLDEQANDLKKSLKSLEELILDLDKNIRKQFDNGFEKINKEFQNYFKILFNGGSAKLIKLKTQDELQKKEETESPEEIEGQDIDIEQEKKPEEWIDLKKLKRSTIYSGVDIQATPPGKRLQNINVLSGGEKALTSIALICAIISNNPSPFVFLDEVDAALDEANSIRFSQIIENLSKKTQFIVITHNRATMEKANVLYGVTMSDDGISKLLSIKLEEGAQFVNR